MPSPRDRANDSVPVETQTRVSSVTAAEWRYSDNAKSHRPVDGGAGSLATLKRIGDAIARGAREPFREILSSAVAAAPSGEAWSALAERHPDRYVRAVRDIAPLAHHAYAPRSSVEHTSVSLDATAVALELVRRYGPERAGAMLEASGLPAALALDAARTLAPPIDKE